jgi:hypothetical protein
MKAISLFCFLSALVLCTTYQELSKYGSINVKTNDYVYLDISSFKTNEMIHLQINLHKFLSSISSFNFKIGQVSVSSYKDSNAWDNLRTVTNRNLISDGILETSFCWTEFKEEGKNYLFIITPDPSKNNAIFKVSTMTIINTGGLSILTKVWVVLGISLPLIAVIILVICVIFSKKESSLESAISERLNQNQGQINSQPSYPAPNSVYQQPPTSNIL